MCVHVRVCLCPCHDVCMCVCVRVGGGVMENTHVYACITACIHMCNQIRCAAVYT